MRDDDDPGDTQAQATRLVHVVPAELPEPRRLQRLKNHDCVRSVNCRSKVLTSALQRGSMMTQKGVA